MRLAFVLPLVVVAAAELWFAGIGDLGWTGRVAVEPVGSTAAGGLHGEAEPAQPIALAYLPPAGPPPAPAQPPAQPQAEPPAQPQAEPPAQPPAKALVRKAEDSRLEEHYAYIRAAQRPTGAIAMTPRQLDINPYFANLAARTLLEGPGHLGQVEAYMEWYLAHLNADGTIDDYRVSGGQEKPLGKYDSADSYAATFLSLVDAYLEAGGELEWVQRHRTELARVAGVIEGLTDEDGLTWAKPYYPLKLLMDNVEVWQGWQAWARVLERTGDPVAAGRVRQSAAAIETALDRFRQPDGTYAWGLAPLGIRRGGNLGRFYPDAVAQFFPFALGLTDDPTGYWAFARAHPEWAGLESDRFPWVFAAVAAARAGDHQRVAQALATVAARHAGLAFPWYVGESAWTIQLLTGVEPVVSVEARPDRIGPRPR